MKGMISPSSRRSGRADLTNVSLPQEIGAAGREAQARQRAASREVKPLLQHVSDLLRRADSGRVQNQLTVKLNGVPSCLKNFILPVDACPAVPLKRMNCVVYPPPLTRCGNNS